MAENSKEVVESVVNVEVKESKKSKPEKVKAVICPNAEAVASVLVQYPHVHTIHVNEEGEWSFRDNSQNLENFFKQYQRRFDELVEVYEKADANLAQVYIDNNFVETPAINNLLQSLGIA